MNHIHDFSHLGDNIREQVLATSVVISIRENLRSKGVTLESFDIVSLTRKHHKYVPGRPWLVRHEKTNLILLPISEYRLE